MNTIYILTIAAVFVTGGDLALAQWARTNQFSFIITGLLLNLLGIIIYAQSLHSENIAIATALFLGLNIFAVYLGSIFLFRESISLSRGIALGILLFSMIAIEIL